MFSSRIARGRLIWRAGAIAVTSLALVASGFVTPSAHSADSPPRKILTGWIPYYSMDTALPSAVSNGDLIKEVMPFWYTLKSETKITDLYTTFQSKLTISTPISTPLTTMRDSGFTIIPTITDGTYSVTTTGVSILATKVTYLANNNFKAGSMVTLSGKTPGNPSANYEFAAKVLLSNSTSFTVQKSDTGVYFSGALAVGVMTLSNMLGTDSQRISIEKAILDLVSSNNFDGIDLDFEGFAFIDGTATWNTTRPIWIRFIQELSSSLHAVGKLLSVTTPVLFDPPSGKKGYYVYDWALMAPFLDRLRIMTYDYSTSSPGPIGPLTWIEQTLQYAVAVVPASKIYLGVAGYGRVWVTKVVGICPSQYSSTIKVGAKPDTFLMNKASDLAASYGATPAFNETFGEETFTYEKPYTGLTSAGLATTCTATRTAWYQDARSYGARAQLVAKYHLGGIAAWTFGMEDPTAIVTVRQVAQSIAPDLVLGTIATDQASVAYGSEIAIVGTFQLPDGQPVTGLAVRLEAKSPGEDQWREIGQATSAPDGTVSLPLILGKNTALRFSSDATWERSASQSVEQVIFSSRLISVAAPTLASTGTSFTISGSIQPYQSGLAVTIEKFVVGKWIIVGKTTTIDAGGNFSLATSESARGINRYRVSVAEDGLFQFSASPIFAILIL
jgi:spore germination protein YaaH